MGGPIVAPATASCQFHSGFVTQILNGHEEINARRNALRHVSVQYNFREPYRDEVESTAREILENHSEAFGRILADSAYALCNLYSLYVTSLTALFWFCDIGSDYALYVALVTTLTR